MSQNKSNDIEQIFLYQQWLHQRLNEYVKLSRQPKLKGREVIMPPNQYGAALMQAYLGKASLAWIAECTDISLPLLRQWRKEAEFLLVMDWSKSIFADDFQEKLDLTDYSPTQCHYISAEISLLENSLRITIRAPLYQRFSKLGKRLISRYKNNLTLSTYDIRLFHRFFLFFLSLEHHWPSPAGHAINEDFIPLVKNVIQPFLEQKEWVGTALKTIQQTAPISHIRLQLESKLSETFKSSL
jgi:hypothetical protein